MTLLWGASVVTKERASYKALKEAAELSSDLQSMSLHKATCSSNRKDHGSIKTQTCSA